MLALGQHRCTDRQAAPGDDPVLFLKQTALQKPVQSLQIVHLRHGDKMVAPKLSALALDATLLVTFARRAELRREAPVRTKGNEPRGLFPLMAAQDLLYRTAQVVESQSAKDPAKPRES